MRIYAALAVVLVACGGDPATPDDGSAGPDAMAALDGGLDGPAVDRCGDVAPACPVLPSGYVRGAGLKAIDECAFPLANDASEWDSNTQLVDSFPAALTRVGIADVLVDLNRVAPMAATVPGSQTTTRDAFKWQSGDENVAYWIPQGITGSFDTLDTGLIGGRRIVLVSWYYDQDLDTGSTEDKGVRIAIVDVTNPTAVTYRFALLAVPVIKNGQPDFEAVHVHAGGLAWVGDHLYVPVTGSGFRVFDLTRILTVNSLNDRLGLDPATGLYDAYSYRYVIPQVGEYKDAGACDAVFSWVAVDRTTHELVSGEYNSTSIGGRVYRWPIGSLDRLAVTPAGRVLPSAAYFAGETHVQGGLAQGIGRYWLSSSRPAAGAGELVRTQPDATSTRFGWGDSPEDLAYEPQRKVIWSLSEAAGARFVYSVPVSAVGGL